MELYIFDTHLLKISVCAKHGLGAGDGKECMRVPGWWVEISPSGRCVGDRIKNP